MFCYTISGHWHNEFIFSKEFNKPYGDSGQTADCSQSQKRHCAGFILAIYIYIYIHPRDKEKCPLNGGVPIIEAIDYKDYMSVNFSGTKVCVPLIEVSP